MTNFNKPLVLTATAIAAGALGGQALKQSQNQPATSQPAPLEIQVNLPAQPKLEIPGQGKPTYAEVRLPAAPAATEAPSVTPDPNDQNATPTPTPDVSPAPTPDVDSEEPDEDEQPVPSPTPTATATWTPDPYADPDPTATPSPTATPYPTWTPPEASPTPTATPEEQGPVEEFLIEHRAKFFDEGVIDERIEGMVHIPGIREEGYTLDSPVPHVAEIGQESYLVLSYGGPGKESDDTNDSKVNVALIRLESISSLSVYPRIKGGPAPSMVDVESKVSFKRVGTELYDTRFVDEDGNAFAMWGGNGQPTGPVSKLVADKGGELSIVPEGPIKQSPVPTPTKPPAIPTPVGTP